MALDVANCHVSKLEMIDVGTEAADARQGLATLSSLLSTNASGDDDDDDDDADADADASANERANERACGSHATPNPR